MMRGLFAFATIVGLIGLGLEAPGLVHINPMSIDLAYAKKGKLSAKFKKVAKPSRKQPSFQKNVKQTPKKGIDGLKGKLGKDFKKVSPSNRIDKNFSFQKNVKQTPKKGIDGLKEKLGKDFKKVSPNNRIDKNFSFQRNVKQAPKKSIDDLKGKLGKDFKKATSKDRLSQNARTGTKKISDVNKRLIQNGRQHELQPSFIPKPPKGSQNVDRTAHKERQNKERKRATLKNEKKRLELKKSSLSKGKENRIDTKLPTRKNQRPGDAIDGLRGKLSRIFNQSSGK